ncbi:aspartate aminotransferase [Nostoc sp.]|uniref:aspartate aminotransferase n=1 Tax=Nostoc sp. TaxID=1180 RepID=UPI002FF98FF3
MFEIKLQETRVYREAKQEGLELGRQEGLKQALEKGQEQAKLELIPRFLAYGISIEEVAQLLNLTIEQVEQVRLATEQESSTSTQ